MAQNWIEREIATGFQKLWLLSLDRTPAAEMAEGAVFAWREAVTENRMFEEQRDAPRFRKAFATLAATCRHWPTPRDFLDALPPIEGKRSQTYIADEASRARVNKMLSEFAKKMHWDVQPSEPSSVPALNPDSYPRCCEKGTREKPLCDACRDEAIGLHGPTQRAERTGGTL